MEIYNYRQIRVDGVKVLYRARMRGCPRVRKAIDYMLKQLGPESS